jgi:octaprenyl-diphosphate synthase
MNLKELLAPIANDMAGVDATIRARLASEVVMINEIGAYIVSAGGKRLRPSLVLLAARAAGCGDARPHLLAAVLEFIHTATLLHDDVVDHSDLRRGRKTANAVWGNAGAVLSGDFLYSRSFQMMVEAGRMDVMQLMADATNAVAEGEVLQLMNCGDPGVDEARYLRVIELKTAVLFRASTLAGAYCADAGPDVCAALAQYGHDLGIAFQLIDDVIDYTSAPEESGKAVGNDLAEGKPTLPLIYAMRSGTPAQAQLVAEAIRNGSVDQIDSVMKVVESTGAIPYTRALAERYRDSAKAVLDKIPDSEYRSCMLQLADFSVNRTA